MGLVQKLARMFETSTHRAHRGKSMNDRKIIRRVFSFFSFSIYHLTRIALMKFTRYSHDSRERIQRDIRWKLENRVIRKNMFWRTRPEVGNSIPVKRRNLSGPKTLYEFTRRSRNVLGGRGNENTETFPLTISTDSIHKGHSIITKQFISHFWKIISREMV